MPPFFPDIRRLDAALIENSTTATASPPPELTAENLGDALSSITEVETTSAPPSLRSYIPSPRHPASVSVEFAPDRLTNRVTIQTQPSVLDFEFSEYEFSQRSTEETVRHYTERAMREISRRIETSVYEQLNRILRDIRRPDRRLGMSEISVNWHYGMTPRRRAVERASVLRDLKPEPKKEKFYKWMRNLPKEIKTEEVSAILIDSNKKVFEEAQTMKHCLWREYEERIKKGKYLVYHVTPPKEICKTGITLGFKRREDNGGWKFDQAKGKSNSSQKDKRLDEIYDKIAQELNKNTKEKERIWNDG